MKAVSNYVLLLLIIALSGCTALETVVKPTYNNGGYTFTRFKSRSLLAADSAVITGKVTTRKADATMLISTVDLDCYAQRTNSETYLLKVKPFDVKSQSRAIALGYLPVETEPFVAEAGDSIVVDFFLVQDERPLINCEGQWEQL